MYREIKELHRNVDHNIGELVISAVRNGDVTVPDSSSNSRGKNYAYLGIAGAQAIPSGFRPTGILATRRH